MHPLDLIKTRCVVIAYNGYNYGKCARNRFQVQRGVDDPTRYTSLLDCVKKMYRNEG